MTTPVGRASPVLGAIVGLLLVLATGCAGVALEATEAGALEAGAGGEGALAPAVNEAAAGAGAVESDEILSRLTTADSPPELRVGVDGDGLIGSIDRNQKFSIDWAQGLVRDREGKTVASIEGNMIYATNPLGSRIPVAEILDTKTLTPSTLYSDATVTSRIVRFLNTGESVQIVAVSNGWYQLSSVDGSNGWVFAPLLLTGVMRKYGDKEQQVNYVTRPAERELIDSTFLAATRIRGDIKQILSSR